MAMNYHNQGYGRQMPFGQGQRGMPVHGMMPGMRQGAPGMNMMPGMQQGMRQGAPGMNMMPGMQQGMRQGPGMNMMPGMQQGMRQGAPGMNMMPGMQQGMQPGMQQAPMPGMAAGMPQGMNAAPGMQQPTGPITFEPYNPSQPTQASPVAPPMPGTNNQNASQFGNFAEATNENINPLAAELQRFIQGEKNAQMFYSELQGLAADERSRSVIGRISDNTDTRRQLLSALYDKMTGGMTYTEKDVPLINIGSFSQGIRAAIEVETNTVRELSVLYDQIENGLHLKNVNSAIQKKLADIMALQQLVIFG